MKKMWKKFKHWLIKKLGGCVIPSQELKITHQRSNIITTQSALTLFTFELARGRYRIEDIKNMLETKCARDIAKYIVCNGLYTLEQCENPMFDQVIYKATVQVVQPSKIPTIRDFENEFTERIRLPQI